MALFTCLPFSCPPFSCLTFSCLTFSCLISADRKMADRKMGNKKSEKPCLFSPLPQNLQLLTRILRFIAPRITARQFAISRAVVNNAIRGRVVIEDHADAVVTIQTGVTEHKFAFGHSPI